MAADVVTITRKIYPPSSPPRRRNKKEDEHATSLSNTVEEASIAVKSENTGIGAITEAWQIALALYAFFFFFTSKETAQGQDK